MDDKEYRIWLDGRGVGWRCEADGGACEFERWLIGEDEKRWLGSVNVFMKQEEKFQRMVMDT